MPRALMRQWTLRFQPVVDRIASNAAIRRQAPAP
jgi:hypothetical protein